jgi:hypothetical protein
MRRSASTIGHNPLDALLDAGRTPSLPASAPATDAGPVALQRPARDRTVHQRLSVELSASLVDRVRNAVYWTPGLTLARFAEEALAAALRAAEAERGGPFPPRSSDLPPGPRLT